MESSQKYCDRVEGRIEAILFKMSEQKLTKKSTQKPFRKYCRFRDGEEILIKALQDIKNGSKNLNSASKKYDIPKSTLHNKLTNKTPNIRKMGPQPVLNELEEQRLEYWILAKAKLGFPMHPSEVKDAVQKILTETSRPNSFNNNRPGDKWLKLFLQRHPNIGKRNTEIISKSRAAVTETAIREWFHDLKEYLVKNDLLDMMGNSSRIYNADETGVRTCIKSGLVLGPVSKNFKNFYEISSGNEKESITVLCTYSGLYPLNPNKVDYSKCISTRRNELFPKPELVDNDLTSQDYESCLKVINHFFGSAKLTEYETVEEKATSEDGTYALWKFCTNFKNTTENVSTKNESKSNFDNTSIVEQVPTCDALTESFLNELPFEIDGVIYTTLDNKDDCKNDYETLNGLDLNQIVFHNNDTNINNDDLVDPADSINETNNALNKIPEAIELADSQPFEEYIWMCEVTEYILDRVFEIAEKKQMSHLLVIYRKDTTQGVIECEKTDKKIEILSNVVIREKTGDNEIWKKHLHWPHQDEKASKTTRKNAAKMPFAITSSKWLEFYEQQEKAKKEKEEAIRIRKQKREQRARSQAEKKKTLKRKREKIDEDKRVRAKRGRDEEENGCSSSKLDLMEVKVTQRNSARKKLKKSTKNMIEIEKDNYSSSSSEYYYLPTVEKNFEKITRSESKNETTSENIEETSNQSLGVGDYVIVNYDDNLYPGIIKTVEHEQYEVSVLEKSSNGKWKWPTVTDQIWYTRNQIVKKIAEPQPIKSRGFYNIEI